MSNNRVLRYFGTVVPTTLKQDKLSVKILSLIYQKKRSYILNYSLIKNLQLINHNFITIEIDLCCLKIDDQTLLYVEVRTNKNTINDTSSRCVYLGCRYKNIHISSSSN